MLSYAAAMLVFASAPAPPPGRSPLDDTTLCEARLMPPGIPQIIARIHVDAIHGVVDKILQYWEHEYSAAWSIPGGTLDENSTLIRFGGLSFALPHDAAYPVTISFLLDGKEVASRRFHEPTLGIVYSSEVRRPDWIGAPRPNQFQPGVDFEVPPDAVPLLARALEEDSAVRAFRLAVSSETRARITAAAAKAPPQR